MSKFLVLARLITFGIVIFFSIIVLGISAHLVNRFNRHLDFAALGVAVSVLTLISLPIMLFLDATRPGISTSYIAVELGWIGFLWIMWLATAGTTADNDVSGGRCGVGHDFSTLCGEVNAMEAFSFLNWLILLAYFIALVVVSVIAYRKGNKQVFKTSVKEASTGSTAQPVTTHSSAAHYNTSSVTANQPPAALHV